MKTGLGKHIYLIGALATLAAVAVAVTVAANVLQKPAALAPEAEVALPGDDLSPAEQFAKEQAGAAIDPASAAPRAPIATETATLEALLTPTLPGGFARTSLTSTSAGAAGMGDASAEALYTRGEAQLRVTVTDLGPLGAMTAVGGGAITTIGGRTMVEDNAGGVAKYTITGRGGAMISAEASGGATMADAKAAVTTISIDRLEALAAQ